MSWVTDLVKNPVGYLSGDTARAKESATNRRFQERMRNTAWQAGVEDMTKAGLNPALAYSQGPSASPGGSMAAQQGPGSVLSSAMQAKRMSADLSLIRQQVRRATAEAAVADNNRWWSDKWREEFDREKGDQLRVGGRPINQDKADRLAALFDARYGKELAAAARESSMAQISGLAGGMAGQFNENFMPAAGRIMGIAGQGADSIAGAVEGLERIARMKDEAFRAYFGFPKKVFDRIMTEIRKRRR